MKELMKEVEKKYGKKDISDFAVGDTVKVYTKFKEAERTRVQIFEGVVISKKGSGMGATFRVRKISYGEGVEKIFSMHSALIDKVEIIRRGKVNKAKLYYLKKRIGKRATKVKEKIIFTTQKEEENREDSDQTG